MKKLLLFSLVICIGFYVNAQNQAKLPAHLLNKSEKLVKNISGEELPVIINESNPFVSSKPVKDLGTQLGTTWYDLQGNSNISNRMMVYSDGTISAVWTMATESAWTTRGTGYNHSTNDGSTWLPMPTVRLEGATRVGWPNISKLTNGTEISVTHAASNGNLCRTTNGGTSWENKVVVSAGNPTLGLIWPRMVTVGNTIHVIGTTATAVAYHGFTAGALVYLKSTDNGDNWSEPIQPTGLDTSNYPTHRGVNGTFSDEYTMAVNGNTIAIVVGSAYTTPALIKSTNDGASWSYKEILHLPIKKFESDGTVIYDINGDAQQDNHYSSDGTNFVTIDNSGKAHVFFGRMKYTSDGTSANYFPYTDGMYYWNEDMNTINYQYKWTDINGLMTYEGIPDTVNFPIITEVVDINNNGTMDLPDNGSDVPFGQYYNSLSSQPNAVILPDGSIYLYYSSIVEGTDGVVGTWHEAFRNVWEIHKLSGQTNNFIWSAPRRVAEDDFTEEVWPCVSPRVTGTAPNYYAHFWYMGDGYPGNSLQPTTGNLHPIVESQIYYIKDLIHPDGINEINVVKNAPAIYPNPASKNVTVSYNLTDAANVTLSIYNMVGQQILTTTQIVNAGEASVNLNIESLPQGVYFIKSDIGKQSFTDKLIVK